MSFINYRTLVHTSATDVRQLAESVVKDSMEIRAAINKLRSLTFDHGSLLGLSDDDHPQYASLAQNENITGDWTITTVGGGTLTVDDELLISLGDIVFDDGGGSGDYKLGAGGATLTLKRPGATGTFEIGSGSDDLSMTLFGALSEVKSITGGAPSGVTIIYGGDAAGDDIGIYSTSHSTRGLVCLGQDTAEVVCTNGSTNIYSPFVFGGSHSIKLRSITANRTLDETDHLILVDATGGNITVTIPLASGKNGRVYEVRRTDNSGNTVTISRTSSDVFFRNNTTAASVTSFTLTSGAPYSRLVSDGGSTWYELM